MLELLGVILAGIGLWLAYNSYHKDHISPNKEKLKYLEDRFLWGQKIIDEPLERLSFLSETEGDVMFGGVQLKDYIEQMQKVKAVVFNNDNLSLIRKSNNWSLYHDDVLKNIEMAIETIYSTNSMLDELESN